MIRRISIKNLKCFVDQEIDFSDLTILAGQNGAGKSSVIQALLLLKAAAETNHSAKSIRLADVFGAAAGTPAAMFAQRFIEKQQILIHSTFENSEFKAFYALGGTNKQMLEATCQGEMPPDSFLQLQYVNAERVGPRLFNSIGTSESMIRRDGDNAAYLVDIADRDGICISSELRGEGEPIKFSYHVEKYLSAVMGHLTLQYDTDYENAFIKTLIRMDGMETPVPQPLTGFGFSYAYPIIVAGLWCSGMNDSLLIIENPEAHLHPMVQSYLGKFLALIASSGVQVIVETHSEHIIDGARLQLAQQEQVQKMLVNFFSYNPENVDVRSITVKENGELTAWPKGFFDQKQEDLRELLRIKMK